MFHRRSAKQLDRWCGRPARRRAGLVSRRERATIFLSTTFMSDSSRSEPPPLPPPPVIDYRRAEELALLDPAAQSRRDRRLIGASISLALAAVCVAIALVLLRAIDRKPDALCSFAWPVLVLLIVAGFLIRRGVRLFNSRNL